jgi:hypothetical protein
MEISSSLANAGLNSGNTSPTDEDPVDAEVVINDDSDILQAEQTATWSAYFSGAGVCPLPLFPNSELIVQMMLI